jgi:hypothetical protein
VIAGLVPVNGHVAVRALLPTSPLVETDSSLPHFVTLPIIEQTTGIRFRDGLEQTRGDIAGVPHSQADKE